MNYKSVKKFENLWQLVLDSTSRNPNSDLFIFKRRLANVTQSYEETLERVKRLANFLKNSGLQKGDKVILYIPNSPYFLELFFASVLLGVIVIPIDLDAPHEMIKQIISETKPKFFFHSANKKFPIKTKNIINVDLLDKFISESKLITSRNFAKNIKHDDIVQILYTSGTTGVPKGVIITHENITTNLYNVLLIFPELEYLSMLQLLPLTHIYAQILIFGLINLGGRVIFPVKVNADEVKVSLNKYKINALPAVPQILTNIKDNVEAKFRRFKLKTFLDNLNRLSGLTRSNFIQHTLFHFIHKQLGGNLEIMVSGGAPLDPKVFSWWQNIGIKIYKGYGATETGPIISFEDKNSPDPFSVGKPLPNQMVKILNNEVLVKGDHVTKGYFKNQVINDKSFTKDGWYKTGDLGFMKKGKLYLNGRIKDMIVLDNGINIFPVDIETKLNRNHQILDSVVLGHQFNNKVEIVAVILSKLPARKIERIINKVNNSLNFNQKIKYFLLWDEADFPRTHTKKIKRNEVAQKVPLLLELAANKKLTKSQLIVKDTLTEDLLEILIEVTKSERNKITDSTKLVSELNIDSLVRADIVGLISGRLNKEVKEELLDVETTFKDLLEIVKRAPQSQSEHIQISRIKNSKFLWFFRDLIGFKLIKTFLFFFFSINVKNKLINNLEQSIVIANHRSNIDGLLFYSYLPSEIRRKTVLLIAQDYWSKGILPLLRIILDLFIPTYGIDRFKDANYAVNISGELLNAGYNIFIFPEGKIVHNHKKVKREFKKGTARLLFDFRLPVIEVKAKGTDVIKEGYLLPSAERHPVELTFVNKTIKNTFDVEAINKELEEDYKEL